MTTTLTYGSLFTGVGGFDMGFDQHEYTCNWQVEWDKHCQQTLAHHWPDVPRHGDVQTVNGHHLQPTDVIIYGSPCQDLSVAGQRRGLDGQKSSMFHEAVRIFKEMLDATNNTYPRIVVWENVPGALTSNRGHDFQTVLTELENIGALSQWWYVLDAQHFGIPQRRRRVFLISVFDPAIAERAGHGDILPIRSSDSRIYTTDQTIGFYRTHGRHDQPQYGISPPLKANSRICIASTYQQPRMLTPIEHERLMGWPDNHTLNRADGKNKQQQHTLQNVRKRRSNTRRSMDRTTHQTATNRKINRQ